MSETLLVTLFGGPGTGKSTSSALAFGELKQRGYNVEQAHEYAKDLTWEKAFGKLGYQPYVTAKQLWRYERLEGQVDAIITDTSPLLALIYGKEENGVTEPFRDWIVNDFHSRNTLNIYLDRDPSRAYNLSGRNQTESEAKALDSLIQQLLHNEAIDFYNLTVDKNGNSHVDEIVALVEKRIGDNGKINQR